MATGRRCWGLAWRMTDKCNGPGGFPPSGSVRRGLRKLALRAQTCAALFPPAEPSSRRARGERKCRCSTASARLKFRRGSVHPKSPFRPAEQRSSGRGSPARLFEPEGRVPRRPPAGSSAGQSFAQRMTGVAGSPFLPSYLDASRVTSKFLSFGSADSLRSYIRPVDAVRTLVRCGP